MARKRTPKDDLFFTLKAGYLNWELHWTVDLNENHYGLCDVDKQRIYIDEEQCPALGVECIKHEIDHAVKFMMNINAGDHPEEEEQCVGATNKGVALFESMNYTFYEWCLRAYHSKAPTIRECFEKEFRN